MKIVQKLPTGDAMKLVDLNTIKISGDTEADRFTSFLSQIGDPYHYKVGDVRVNVQFSGGDKTLEDAFFAICKSTVGPAAKM